MVGGYTLAGTVSSGALGAALGALGAAVDRLAPQTNAWRLAGFVLFALVAVGSLGRELELLRLPLPQLRRQTGGLWARSYGLPAASILWGLDLGLLFTTWLTFSGVWLLAVLAIASSDAAFGAALLVSYWLGRALSVWLAPVFLRDAGRTADVMVEISRERPFFRRFHALALSMAIVLFVLVQTPLVLR